jgi:isopentenyl-diphosphate Delta-isomerase
LLTDRKNQHLDIVLSGQGTPPNSSAGFDVIQFEHSCLPEMGINDIDLSTSFLDKRISAPFLVSSMTGGPMRAEQINRNLAIACQELNLALAVGSQRIAIETADASGLGPELRRMAPDIPLLANFGAAQLNLGFGMDQARKAVEMIGADALIIHLNPLQEAVQNEGNRNWSGLLNKIGSLARSLDFPVVVKEVGCGISGRLARQLVDAGVAVIDVAGAGGTSWAAVEAERAATPRQKMTARAFAHWGIPTALAVADMRQMCPDTTIVGSGGIRDGLDAAKALRLGADIVGQAAGVLQSAALSAEAVVDHFSAMIDQLSIACFCTGSVSLEKLRKAPLQANLFSAVASAAPQDQ